MVDTRSLLWLRRLGRAVGVGLLGLAFGMATLGLGLGVRAGASGTDAQGGWSSLSATATPTGTSRAQVGEAITDYDVTATVTKEGTAEVTETISYDFAGNSRHGIERFLQVRFELNADDPVVEGREGRWERVTPLDNIKVSSPSGAPTDVEVLHQGSIENIRIGDPDTTISGQHTYVISYELKGVVNAFDGYEEVPLNVIGDQWRVAISQAGATVTVPAPVTEAKCFFGPYGATSECDVTVEGDTVRASRSNLSAGSGMTLYLKVPEGTFNTTEPILDEVWSLQRAFSLTPATIGGGLGLGALAAGIVGLLGYRVGRDRRYTGGVVEQSFGNDEGDEERLGLGRHEGITVEFVPPDQVLPGEAGTIIDEKADTIDVSATLVDLAVRGYLRIEDLTDGDYRLVELNDDHTGLVAYERTLLTSLFAAGKETTISELKYSFASRLKVVQGQMYDDLVSHGWYRKRPDRTRASWMGLAVVALLGAGALTVVLAIFTHWALIGIPLVLAALALMAVANQMPARTGKGTAMYRRVLGFREMFAAGEGDRQRWAAEQNLFSRYLPYAMVFGMTEQWARTFAQLSAEGLVQTEQMGWWVSPRPFDWIVFSHSLNHFGSYAAGTFSAVQRSSAGGAGGSSGFGGGGFSGGGFGGGGGGSW
ncbi:MAG: DUF2207 domain-containing protein [Microthrixaceae bacterium]